MSTHPRTPNHFPKMKDRGARRRLRGAMSAPIAESPFAQFVAIGQAAAEAAQHLVEHIAGAFQEAYALWSMGCRHDDTIEINGGKRCIDCEDVILDLGEGRHVTLPGSIYAQLALDPPALPLTDLRIYGLDVF